MSNICNNSLINFLSITRVNTVLRNFDFVHDVGGMFIEDVCLQFNPFLS